MIGLMTLIQREISRFMNVYTQTIIAPVISTMLFYAVFALAFGDLRPDVGDVPYLRFLVPGLVMMTMVQNAFTNTSSSIVISKVQGNIVDVLMPPLSPMELYLGFISGGVVRGLIVGAASLCAMYFVGDIQILHPFYILGFAVLGTMMMASIGVAAGIWSDKFDHIAAVTNFLVTPLTFLSGTFYSIHQLPEVWQTVASYNPFFYMIDGFRYGFIGHADSAPALGLLYLIAANVVMGALSLWMLRTGYKIKS